MTRGSIPPLLLEQLELDELTPERRAAVEAELAALDHDPRAALREDDAEIRRDYPAQRVMDEVRRKAARAEPPRSRGAWWPWLLVPGLAAAAALALVIGLGDRNAGDGSTGLVVVRDDEGTTGAEVTRIKGGSHAHLVVDRKRADGHERLVAGDLLAAGDVVQVSVVPDGAEQAVVLSLDGRGVVTLHHPAAPELPASLSGGAEIPLPSAYELDDAPAFERFVLVTRSDAQTIDVAAVLAAAEQLAADPTRARSEPLPLVGEGWQQSSLELRKPEGTPSPTPMGGEP
jgi:hypothetical protein